MALYSRIHYDETKSKFVFTPTVSAEFTGNLQQHITNSGLKITH